MNTLQQTFHFTALPLRTLVLVFMLVQGCDQGTPTSLNDVIGRDSGMLSTGPAIQVHQASVPANGGIVTVSTGDSPLNGLTLTVPHDSYSSGMLVSISYAEIRGHRFGAHFHPVTPLISIDNGGEFAATPMRLRIPVSGLGNRLPVAFYYDRTEGTLEALTPLERTFSYLDVAVRHFSSIVVSAADIDVIQNIGGFTTMFDPAVNGWSFANHGTYPEPKGICAGMSIGAAHFFKGFRGSPLAGLFDNDRYWWPTPTIWQDDASGMKFCAELQRTFVTHNTFWSEYTPLIPILQSSDEDHFWSLCYSMFIINQPQFIYLEKKGDPDAGAHAIIAYDFTVSASEGRISIYDPNYDRKSGEIIFDRASATFRPYTSSTNVNAIQQGYTFDYDVIRFIPLSTMCDLREIDRIWKKIGDGSIGNGQYPEYELYAAPVGPSALPRVKLNDVFTKHATYIPFEEFTVEIVPKDASISFSLASFVHLPNINQYEIKKPATTIALERPGADNLVGIKVQAIPAGHPTHSWAGFHWFNLRLRSLWIEPADTSVSLSQEVRLTARSNGNAPAQARYEWDFGDGATRIVQQDSTVRHTYTERGTFTVTITLYDQSNNQEIEKATTTVTVTDLRAISITLLGPGTIKGSDGEDIPVIGFSNKTVVNAPPLTWNGDDFVVDWSYQISVMKYNTRITGTISQDRKSLVRATGITSGTGSDAVGDYAYSSAIVIQDFPLETIGVSTGAALNGPAAQAKVTNISYRWMSTNTQGDTFIRDLGSIDWSNQKTELSVYFFK
jgi:hypothetical protein